MDEQEQQFVHEDPAAEEEQQHGPHFTVFHAAGLFILLIVLEFWMEAILGKTTKIAEGSWMFIAIRNLISGLLTAKAGALLAGFTLTGLLFSPRVRWLTLIPVTICILGVTILSSELQNLLVWIQPLPKEYTDLFTKLEENSYGLLFTISVIAPLTEELLFRGVILEGLRQNYRLLTAVFMSSVLFALAHIIPWLIVNAFFIGLILSWIKIETGSLVPCLYAHALYNGMPWIVENTMKVQIPGFNLEQDTTVVQFQPVWFDLLGVALLFIGGILLWQMTIRTADGQSQE